MERSVRKRVEKVGGRESRGERARRVPLITTTAPVIWAGLRDGSLPGLASWGEVYGVNARLPVLARAAVSVSFLLSLVVFFSLFIMTANLL